jgi:hypothetical protein
MCEDADEDAQQEVATKRGLINTLVQADAGNGSKTSNSNSINNQPQAPFSVLQPRTDPVDSGCQHCCSQYITRHFACHLLAAAN